MENDNRPGGVLLIGPTSSSEIAGEIQAAIRIIHEHEDINVVMDFSRIGAVDSSDAAHLLRLRKLLRANRRRLVLSNVGFVAKASLSVSGLDIMFEMAPDRLAALASL